MKKGFLLLMFVLTFISLSAQTIGKGALKAITAKQATNLNNSKLFKKKITARSTTEQLSLNYRFLDSFVKASAGGATYSRFIFPINNNYDTSRVPSTPSFINAKYALQWYNRFSDFDDATNSVVNYVQDSITITIDSIDFAAFYNKTDTTAHDSIIIIVYEDSTKMGNTSVAANFDKGLTTGAKEIARDTFKLDTFNNDDFINYTFRKKVTLTKGSGFLVKYEFRGNIENSANLLGDYSDFCNDQSFASQTQFGNSFLPYVIYQTGDTFRLPVWNSTDVLPSTNTSACKKMFPQNWYIFPNLTLDIANPFAIITSDQNTSTVCKDNQVQLNVIPKGYSAGTTFTYNWSPSAGLSATNIANPIATVGAANVVYSVTVTPNSGNTVSASRTVESYALAATLSNKLLSSCTDSNQSIVVSTTGGGTLAKTYSWSSGLSTTATHPKVKQGTYTVTVSNVFCSVSVTSIVSMSSTAETNTLDFSVDPASPCVLKDAILSNNSTNITWNFVWKNGTNTISTLPSPTVYQFPTAGVARVTLDASKGACIATQVSKNITVKAVSAPGCGSSIEDHKSLADDIKIYPNPSKDGRFTISSTATNPLNINITDILGKTVYSQNLGIISKQVINLGNVQNGVYFIEINNGTSTFIQKLIMDK